MENHDGLDELVQRLRALEEKNREMRAWQSSVLSTLGELADLMGSLEDRVNATVLTSRINQQRMESLRYELQDPDYVSPVFKPHFLSMEETRRQIIEEGRSIARFGDGEFSAIRGIQRWNFQKEDPALGQKLKEVLQSNDPGFLVGLNENFYGDLSHLSEAAADGVRSYMTPETRKFHASLLDPERVYASAMICFIGKEQDVTDLRRFWNDRDCVFIEGEYTRMGVGNDLFDNCRSISRILCPAENAFDRYDEIMTAATKQPKDRLMLLALGPTATAMAYDLYREGYQALDVGHVDLLYEKFRAGYNSLTKVTIPYKYCNCDESGTGRQIEDIDDPEYRSQIVAKIS
ncbi:MAG: GT-D fold domain-containing protein [Lachnospiraceae bacterium]|nr:GT-D fold domain-containing protein [Lachnospiraceae bacterium]